MSRKKPAVQLSLVGFNSYKNVFLSVKKRAIYFELQKLAGSLFCRRLKDFLMNPEKKKSRRFLAVLDLKSLILEDIVS